jgi:hypothetical protein
MAINSAKPGGETQGNMRANANKMISDIKGEVKHEVTQINATRTPVNPTQDDHIVRRHVFGLSVGFFALIVAFLILVIAGFLIFGRH